MKKQNFESQKLQDDENKKSQPKKQQVRNHIKHNGIDIQHIQRGEWENGNCST